MMFKRLALGLLAAQSVAATRFAMYIDQLVQTSGIDLHTLNPQLILTQDTM